VYEGFRSPGGAPGGGEQQSAATAQAARGWSHPPYRHFQIQSYRCLGPAFEVGGFPNPSGGTYTSLLSQPPHWHAAYHHGGAAAGEGRRVGLHVAACER
jgi:hypothetical protein